MGEVVERVRDLARGAIRAGVGVVRVAPQHFLAKGCEGGSHAATEARGDQGSIASSVSIWSGVSAAIDGCRQPVARMMCMASGRFGSRPLMISLA